MTNTDSVEDAALEAIAGISRVGLAVAGRFGEQLSRAHETNLRGAQAAQEQQGRELQARFDAERAAARAQLAPVMDTRWWDTASGRDIERVHEAATAWKGHDPAARAAAGTIRDQVKRRYGLDINNLGADESSVAAVLAKAEHDREQAEKERGTGSEENAQAAQLLAEADREDQERRQAAADENESPQERREEASLTYDSAERRAGLAASLDGVADREAVKARLSADQDQGRPASAAVAKDSGKAPKALKTRGGNGQARLLQKDMSR